MGGIRTVLPVTKRGMFHKKVEARLDQGKATVKAVMTNGSISVDKSRIKRAWQKTKCERHVELAEASPLQY